VKLFDKLPPNLFSILVSKNKALYAEALFVLRKAFKQHMTLNKSDLVAMLIAALDETLFELDLEAEKDEFKEGVFVNRKMGHILIENWASCKKN